MHSSWCKCDISSSTNQNNISGPERWYTVTTIAPRKKPLEAALFFTSNFPAKNWLARDDWEFYFRQNQSAASAKRRRTPGHLPPNNRLVTRTITEIFQGTTSTTPLKYLSCIHPYSHRKVTTASHRKSVTRPCTRALLKNTLRVHYLHVIFFACVLCTRVKQTNWPNTRRSIWRLPLFW